MAVKQKTFPVNLTDKELTILLTAASDVYNSDEYDDDEEVSLLSAVEKISTARDKLRKANET